MSPKCTEFVERLSALNPSPDDYTLEGALYELCELLKGETDSTEVVPHIFRFIEAPPSCDLGSPGPLVHFIESCQGYQAELIASVQRKPTPITAWMVNRVLNSNLSAERRVFFLSLLKSIVTNPEASGTTKGEAGGFLEFQSSK